MIRAVITSLIDLYQLRPSFVYDIRGVSVYDIISNALIDTKYVTRDFLDGIIMAAILSYNWNKLNGELDIDYNPLAVLAELLVGDDDVLFSYFIDSISDDESEFIMEYIQFLNKSRNMKRKNTLSTFGNRNIKVLDNRVKIHFNGDLSNMMEVTRYEELS